jgi:AcrR family transcriptional regulator
MEVKRRTQAERSAATRAALIGAARRLFAERGFADVGTPELAAAAGVTRGAMYHQFADKTELFAAVFEAVEEEVVTRIGERVAASGGATPVAALRAALDAWGDLAAEPEVVRIALLDAPVVLGQERWRAIALRFGLGLAEQLVGAAVEAGELPALPVRATTQTLLGAADEAAVYAHTAEDPAAAREEVRAVLRAMVDGLAARA